MSIMVAVPDSPEGSRALTAAVAEARQFRTDLVAVNLGLAQLDISDVAPEAHVTVVDRIGRTERDPVDAVLHAITVHKPTRLIIGIKRRTPVGKAILGSISQRLLLHSPIPVLAVKLDDDDVI